MRTSKNMRKKRNFSRRNKKGGYFFNKPTVVPSAECDVNNLTNLTKMPEVNNENGELKPLDERIDDLNNMTNRLRDNYNTCCPKGFMGRKNTSPYCNQLDTTFKSIEQHKRDISGYYGDETNVEKIKEVMDAPMIAPVTNAPPTKPWYQFWGGKNSRRRHKKRIHKRKNTRRRK